MIQIKTNNEEILKGKFADTFSTIEGYYREAKGDISVDQSYSAGAVFRRIERIKEAFLRDINNLSKNISVVE